MAKKLSLVEATALERLAKQVVDEKKKAGEKLKAGSYPFDFSVDVDGNMSRAGDTEVTPAFKMDTLLKAVVLKYAETLDDPKEWLGSLLSMKGALGAVVQLGPSGVIDSVPSGLVAIWNDCEVSAKQKHQGVAKKKARCGNTTVAGEVTRASNPAVRSAKTFS
tara:strand:+ start:15044 stop:15532 length:489 start_codon:yes stop_codon:yes gene_type:complete